MNQSKLNNALEIEESTGRLFWRGRDGASPSDRRWNKLFAGKRAGSKTGNGYREIQLNGKRILEHRAVFLMSHGFIPSEIDHADGDKTNNIISNLRPATRSQNQQNRKAQKGSSLFKGVCWCSTYSKWRARIYKAGKEISLGYHVNEIDAARSYDDAAQKHHGEFARLNFGA